MDKLNISVVNDEESKTYIVHYSKRNRYTNRINNESFRYYYGARTQNVPSATQVKNLTNLLLSQFDDKILFGVSKYDPNKISSKQIKGLLTRELRIMNRSHKGKTMLNDFDKEQDNDQPSQDVKKIEYTKWSKESIFKPEESGKTTAIIGPSFSGKSTMFVNELNKLKPGEYDKIIIFTESPNAEPLQKINKKLDVKIFDRFVPNVVKVLKDINQETNNRFKFFVAFDDVINLKQDNLFSKLILIMRNSNISTCVITQYIKLMTPGVRNSLHSMYFINLKTLDYEYILRSFLASHFRQLLNEKGSYTKLSEMVKEYCKGSIVYYDNRKDKLNFYLR
jgi:hypothetical protein